ncbi:MAG: hypothetical protein QOH19_1913 [Actinomycetota bacterium]|jgi:hypothetical protein|nr:hypothetical protein [Actinomycetota bacterium]
MQDPGSSPELHPRSDAAPGTPARSPGTIVFVHGGNVATWMWEPQVRALGGEIRPGRRPV